jgi:hypothetical protein
MIFFTEKEVVFLIHKKGFQHVEASKNKAV